MTPKLWPFQDKDVTYLEAQSSALVIWDMGLGKTPGAIARDDRLRRARQPDLYLRGAPTLIVAPLQTHEQWYDWLYRYHSVPNVFVFSEDRDKALKQLVEKRPGFYVLHWELLRFTNLRMWAARELWPVLSKTQFFHIVADEVHRSKERRTQNAKALKKLKTTYKTGLTGTPIINKPLDLFSILQWLYPKEWTGYWKFVDRYAIMQEQYRGTTKYPEYVGPKNVEELQSRIRPYTVQRTKEEVLPDLPDRYYCTPLESPIMMADFTFKPIGEVKVGDFVMGWTVPLGKGTRYELKPAKVLSTGRLRRPLVKAVMESGRSVRCTPDHQWRSGVVSSIPWVQLGTHIDGRKNRPKTLLHVIGNEPRKLSLDENELALWLGGIIDGEGCFRYYQSSNTNRGYQWSISQSKRHNPEVYARIELALKTLEIPHVAEEHLSANRFRLKTSRDAALKILTWCKPVKNSALIRRITSGGFTPDRVISVEEEQGLHEVAWLETETGNYVAWGYASKNSTIRVDLAPAQRRAYDSMRRNLVAWIGENEDTPLAASATVAKLSRLQQFAVAHAELIVTPHRHKPRCPEDCRKEFDQDVPLREPSSKLDAVMEILSDTEEPVVVFSQSKSGIRLLATRLSNAGIPYSLYHGDLSKAKKRDELDRFKSGETRVFAATGQSGGEGIDGLQRAHTLIRIDRSWSHSSEDQEESRLHRAGQESPVHVIDIVARDTVDQLKNRRIIEKKNWAKLVLEGLR